MVIVKNVHWPTAGHLKELLISIFLVQGAFFTAGQRSCWGPITAGKWASGGRPHQLPPSRLRHVREGGQTHAVLMQDTWPALRVTESPLPRRPQLEGTSPSPDIVGGLCTPLGLPLRAQCFPCLSNLSFSIRSKRPRH